MPPDLTAVVSGPSCQTVASFWRVYLPTRSDAVRSSWQATVISVRPSRQLMCSTKRVLPQPVGPLSITGRRALYAGFEELDLVPEGQVVRLLRQSELLDALAFNPHRPDSLTVHGRLDRKV